MFYLPRDNLIILVGNYGSGKTEVAVNLAVNLVDFGHSVSIADLDIVNPYFRCREARELMQEKGIRVVVPSGAYTWADLPIVLPEIKSMLHPSENDFNIFDVGGDDVGARILSSFTGPLRDGHYALWQVINARRPFTDTVEGCLDMLSSIEKTSRLKVTGLVVNTHLMTETNPEIILEGVHLARKVGDETGLPVELVAVMEELIDLYDWKQVESNILPLKRHMLPPWLRHQSANGRSSSAGSQPIGRPQGAS